MYQAFEIVVLFGISRISFLRLKKIKEQRDKYLNGEYWVPSITGNSKEDREIGYSRDIFMAKVSIVLSSLIGVVDLINWVSQLFL
ncbi:hypothetical protein [Streptococcus hyointestinalis]